MLSSYSWRVAACCLLLILLSACQTQSKLTIPDKAAIPGKPADWQEHQARLNALSTWTIRGKLGVRAPKNSGSGSLTWHQVNDTFEVNLRGPFGQGAMSITGTADAVRLEIAGQGSFDSNSPSQLLNDQFGWEIPVESLAHWVKGGIAPGRYDALETDEFGRLSALAQQGWQINYLRYGQYSDVALPQKIKLERESIKITLVIKQWLFEKQNNQQ